MGQRAICVKPIILSNHAVSSSLLSFRDIKQVLQTLTSRNFMHSHIRNCESQLFPVQYHSAWDSITLKCRLPHEGGRGVDRHFRTGGVGA